MIESLWINMTFCCIGMEVKNGIIVDAPPIMRVWKGQRYDKWYRYYYDKGCIREIKRTEQTSKNGEMKL